MKHLTVAQAIKALKAIDLAFDPETAHYNADDVLLQAVPEALAEAYRDCVKRTGRWWYA